VLIRILAFYLATHAGVDPDPEDSFLFPVQILGEW
jgi:hypothetical protein